MIIFGISASLRDGKPVDGSCHHCDQPMLASFRCFRYFHLFWVPVIPLGCSDGLTCGHCQHTISAGDLKDRAKQHIKSLNTATRRPLWHFLGTLAVVAMIISGINSSNKLDVREQQAVEQPQIGDVWVVNVDQAFPDAGFPYHYSAAKVVQVDSEGVELLLSDWSFSLSSGAKKEAKEKLKSNASDYFVNEIEFSLEELKLMQANNIVKLVDV